MTIIGIIVAMEIEFALMRQTLSDITVDMDLPEIFAAGETVRSIDGKELNKEYIESEIKRIQSDLNDEKRKRNQAENENENLKKKMNQLLILQLCWEILD